MRKPKHHNVGDILICQAEETGFPALVAHWDPSTTNFVTRAIPLPGSLSGHFEHVIFAPINILRLP